MLHFPLFVLTALHELCAVNAMETYSVKLTLETIEIGSSES